MNDAGHKPLSAAVVRLLRPLVRLLLRNGMSYGAFADLAKWVYVDVATNEFGVAGRRQTDSRVSVITGLTRKEVARLKGTDVPDDHAAAEHYNRAARVIGGWLRDTRFVDAAGRPAALAFDGDSGFSALVKAYSGDMPPRAVLDELLRVGAVERGDDGRLALLTAAYVPRDGDAGRLHILGSDVALLIDTIDHNLRAADEPRFQRKVAYDNLPAEAIPALRALTAEKGQALLEELNRVLAAHDRDINPAAAGGGRKHAGVGIYYFEEDVSEENPK